MCRFLQEGLISPTRIFLNPPFVKTLSLPLISLMAALHEG